MEKTMEISDEALAGGVHRISLSGRMDLQGAQRIDVRLAGMTAAPRKAIVIDLSGVTFLASIGIRSLLLAAKGVEGRGGHVALTGASPLVRKVLETAGIDTIIPLHDDLAAAVAAATGR